MLHSRSQLLKDVERWQQRGWITAPGADAIRQDIESRRSGPGLAGVLATLAAVLVGFGVMSFVAANWQEMSKLVRLLVIFAGLWGAFAGAAWLRMKGHPWFADAALLAGIAIYGAGIMLIAQMYHMDGHPPDAVLLWGAGAVVAGLLTRSNTVLAASLVIFCVWSLMETGAALIRRGPHWSFLLAWAVVAAGFAWTRWRPGLQLLAISLSGWIIQIGYLVGNGQTFGAHSVVTLIGMALAGASIAFGREIDRWRQVSGAMLAYGFAIAFAGALALQFVADRKGDMTLLLGALTLAAIVGVLGWAWRTDNRPVMWLAYGAFSIEIFSLYVKKIGSLMGTSAFFLATGLLVAALAWIAYRLHGTAGRTDGEPA